MLSQCALLWLQLQKLPRPYHSFNYLRAHGQALWGSFLEKDEAIQFCMHYSKLNAFTCLDLYPLPHVDEWLDKLGQLISLPSWILPNVSSTLHAGLVEFTLFAVIKKHCALSVCSLTLFPMVGVVVLKPGLRLFFPQMRTFPTALPWLYWSSHAHAFECCHVPDAPCQSSLLSSLPREGTLMVH